MCDGTERLCQAVYGRSAKAYDYLGGSNLLHDATELLLDAQAKSDRERGLLDENTQLRRRVSECGCAALEVDNNRLREENARLRTRLAVLGSLALREALADLEHDRWSRWQVHLHERGIRNDNCSITLMAEDVARWDRQIGTPYAELTEREKDSDRKEADNTLAVIQTALAAGEEE